MKSILMMVCGVLSMGGGLLHTAGLPIIHRAVEKANVTGDLAHIVDLAWVFMGMAMIAFGGILLTCGIQMRKKNYGGTALAARVSACLTLFSLGAMIKLGFDFRFLYFLVVGVLAGFACLPAQKTS